MELGSLYYDLTIDDKNLNKQLDSADKSVQSFGDNVSKNGSQLKDTLNKAAVGIGAVGVGLTLVAKNATDFTVNLVKSSIALGRQIGTTTEEASRLTAAFTRMGLATDNVQAMFGIFAKNIVQSTQNATANRDATEKLQIQIQKTKAQIADTTAEIKKNGDKTGDLSLKLKELNNNLQTQKDSLNQSADAFAKLGVSTTDAKGKQKDFNTLLFEVADKFKAMPDGIDKTALSMALFGRSGKDMIKVLNLGSQGIQDLEKEADKLGLTLSADTITKIQKLIASQKDLKQQTDALKISVGTATAPVLTDYNKALNSITQTFLNAPGPIHTGTVYFLAFGGAILSGIAAFIGFLANLDQALPALIKLANALKITAAAQFLLDAAVLAFPVIAIIVAVAAIGVALYELITHFDTVKAFFNTDLGLAVGVGLMVLFPLIGIALMIATHWQMMTSAITSAWTSVINFFQSIPGAIASAFSTVWGVITAPFRAAFQAIVGFWNNTVGKINFSTPSWIPGIGNKSWGFPKFDQGVTNFAGGLAYVHAGEMLVNLPKGTDVVPKAGMGATVNIGVVQDRSDADYILRRIDTDFYNRSRGGS